MKNFAEFGLCEELNNILIKLNFNTPTPIQSEAIPVALEGRDVLGTSQTGTGKTGAFAIPLISHLLNNPSESALVVAPTRELALQVLEVLKKFTPSNSKIRSCLLIGGNSIGEQLAQLKQSPRIIVGTPGRINDHIIRNNDRFKNTRFLVLDEVDRMLDMGFDVQIDKILSVLPKKRQTLMFSATLPDNIQKLSAQYLNDPVRIAMKSLYLPEKQISQETLKIGEKDKYSQLLMQIDQREGSIIIFIKTKIEADKMAAKLRALNHTADAMHGDLRQRQRDRVIKYFKNKKNRIMVATDVAARGLDIPHIEHVINYDLPHCPEDYVHRIGRTARAGATGSAINFVSPQDEKRWKAICRLIGIAVEEKREARRASNSSRSNPSRENSKRSTPRQRNSFPSAAGERKERRFPKFLDEKPSRKRSFFDSADEKSDSRRSPKFFGEKNSRHDSKPFNPKKRSMFGAAVEENNNGSRRPSKFSKGNFSGKNEKRADFRQGKQTKTQGAPKAKFFGKDKPKSKNFSRKAG